MVGCRAREEVTGCDEVQLAHLLVVILVINDFVCTGGTGRALLEDHLIEVLRRVLKRLRARAIPGTINIDSIGTSFTACHGSVLFEGPIAACCRLASCQVELVGDIHTELICDLDARARDGLSHTVDLLLRVYDEVGRLFFDYIELIDTRDTDIHLDRVPRIDRVDDRHVLTGAMEYHFECIVILIETI